MGDNFRKELIKNILDYDKNDDEHIAKFFN